MGCSGAIFSPCRTWRYTLTRDWLLGNGERVAFIGLNPSTADETLDDPTIRRCINYAKAWGYSGMTMLNLFGYRATDPEDMKAFREPIGPENDAHIIAEAGKAEEAIKRVGEATGGGGPGFSIANSFTATSFAATNVTIADIKIEQVGQDKDTKPVAYSKGKSKGLVLNKTNANKITSLMQSPVTEEWHGRKIRLFATETNFGAELVDCIRIKAAPSAGGESSPWDTHWDEMAKKTCAKAHSKWLPVPADVLEFFAREDAMLAGETEASPAAATTRAPRTAQLAARLRPAPDPVPSPPPPASAAAEPPVGVSEPTEPDPGPETPSAAGGAGPALADDEAQYAELSAKNPNWKKVYDDYSKFRAEQNWWFRFGEARFDSFMQAQKL